MRNFLAVLAFCCMPIGVFAQATSTPIVVTIVNPPSDAVTPTIGGIVPNSTVKGAAAVFTITGTGFNALTTVNVLLPQSVVPLVVAPTSWTPTTLVFSIPSTVAGPVQVSVTNPAVIIPPPPPPPPPPPACLNSTQAWKNMAIAPAPGAFRVEFDATVPAAASDAVIGVSPGAASNYTSIAAGVRFNVTNTFDARNGAAYAANAVIPYVKAIAYHVIVDVNLPARTYSVTVNGGKVATNFAFRTEQAAATSLLNLTAYADVGSVSACNVKVSALVVSNPPPTPHSVSLAWDAEPLATGFFVLRSSVNGSGYAKLNATPITANSFSDPGVTNGQTYFYVVTATDGKSESAFSSQVTAVIPGP